MIVVIVAPEVPAPAGGLRADEQPRSKYVPDETVYAVTDSPVDKDMVASDISASGTPHCRKIQVGQPA